MNNFLYSYTDFIRERNFFKMVDDKGMNRYDSPSALYYKIVFYFTDDSGLLGIYNIGDETHAHIENIKKMTPAFDRKTRKNKDPESDTSAKKAHYGNTAYNYLLVNDELERAEMLKQFIILLSDINTSAPWYFQEISGLDGALERKIFSEGEVKLEDKPRQFTIKCLQDAYDNRIGTLLDLYRAACFSYQNKKEIVPRNLRKFNMGILVFNAPIRGKSGKSGDKYNMIIIPDGDVDFYVPSAKLIELRNCEFDYNSAKSAWGTLNTTDDAFSPEYTITINYDDAYESRYNDIMSGIVTDFINIDINTAISDDTTRSISIKNQELRSGYMDLFPIEFAFDSVDKSYNYWLNSDISKINSNTSDIYKGKIKMADEISENVGTAFGANILTSQLNNLKDKVSDFIQLPSISKNDNIHDYGTVNKLGEFEYLNRLSGMGGFAGSVMQQAVGTATSALKDKVSQVYLGNIHSLSVSNMLDMGKKFLSGDIAGGISSAKKYNNPQIGDKSMVGSKLPEYNGKDNPQQRNIRSKMDGELWNDPAQRDLGFNPITHEVWTDAEQRQIGQPNGEIHKDPTQRDLGFNPITHELWTDPFQRNIDSDTIGELPGYIKGRTKFLNEMNTKQSIRNNI